MESNFSLKESLAHRQHPSELEALPHVHEATISDPDQAWQTTSKSGDTSFSIPDDQMHPSSDRSPIASTISSLSDTDDKDHIAAFDANDLPQLPPLPHDANDTMKLFALWIKPYTTATSRMQIQLELVTAELVKTKQRLRKRHKKLVVVTKGLVLEQKAQEALNETLAKEMETRKDREEVILEELKVLHDALYLDPEMQLMFIRCRDAVDRTMFFVATIIGLNKITERTGSHQFRMFLLSAESSTMTNTQKNQARLALLLSRITPDMLKEPDFKSLVECKSAMSILTWCDACSYIRILGDTVAHNPFDNLETMKANILRLPSKFSPHTAEGMINIVEFVYPRYREHEAVKAAAEAKAAAAAHRAAPNSTVSARPPVIPVARGAVTGVARRGMPQGAMPQGVPPRGQGGSLRGAQLPGASVAVRGTPPKGMSNPIRGAASQGRSSRGASPARGVSAGATTTPQSWAAVAQKATETTTEGVIGVSERGKVNDGGKKGKGKAWGV